MLTRNPNRATGNPGPGQAPPAYYQSASYGPYWESDWERVCATPCRTQVPAGSDYRIGGQGITPSDSFPIRPGQVQLDVSPGSSSARGLGTYMTVFGFLLAAAGGVFLAISASSSEDASADADKVGVIVSTAGLVGGALIGGVGIVLMVVHTTDVRDERGKQIGAGSLPTLNAIGHF